MKETTDLVKSLQGFGIKAESYKKPPAGKDVFVISILPKKPAGVILVHQGLAKVSVSGSKKLCQAAIIVKERARVLTRKVKATFHQELEPSKVMVETALRRNFPLGVPFSNTKWTYKNVSTGRGGPGSYSWTCTATVTASIGNRSTNSFLVGMDETHNFISPLPQKPKSLEDARKMLKPIDPKIRPKLRAGTRRQGEWFFEPLNKEEVAEIEKIAAEKQIKGRVLGRTTHSAASTIKVTKPKKMKGLYARGFITDNRKGHHENIFLAHWHRVVRNREIPMPLLAEGRRKSWD